MTTSRITRWLSSFLHRLPTFHVGTLKIRLDKIGSIYDGHYRFFNDGIIELSCLIIANVFIWFFTHFGFIETSLIILNLALVTPITFGIKYTSHRLWVWKE